ncbi:MAG: DUF3098 domain-containing protein [Flavobacteriales bacterium]|nr:DUF3098 domain-containing protein [Flavobacteriales bacterium]
MSQDGNSEKQFAFGKENYILVAAGFLCIVVGFILMAGGGSEDPNVFSEEIFSTRRITIAPIVVLLGFVLEIIGIMYPSKTK